jgi:MFS family permease
VKEANLKNDDIGNSLSLYSVTYVTLQPLSTMMGRKTGAKNWISLMLAVWGAISMAHAATKSTASFLALRLLLGAAEAGFVPTSFYYMSTLYPKEYLGFRAGMFTGMYSVSAAFSGLIATGVLKINSPTMKGWQVLFILEGGLTVLMAFVTLLVLPGSASTAWFLSGPEREHASRRLNADIGEDGDHEETNELTRRDIIDAFKDWRKLLVIVCNIFVVLPVTAFTTFLPLITKGTFSSIVSWFFPVEDSS